MQLNKEYLSLIGIFSTCLIACLCTIKKLRSDKRISILVILTFPLAIFGLIIRSPEYQMKGANAADCLWSPFLCIALYGLFRYLYKKKYYCEPTYNRLSWYDPDEKRMQNWFDVIVHVVPFIFAVSVPIIITCITK